MLSLLEQLVQYSQVLEEDEFVTLLEGCVFNKDFGPWKADEEIETLQLIDDDTCVKLQEIKGKKLIKECKVELKVVED